MENIIKLVSSCKAAPTCMIEILLANSCVSGVGFQLWHAFLNLIEYVLFSIYFPLRLFCVLFIVFLLQGRGNKSSGDCFHAAPNIDHSQDFVRKDLTEWLCWLRLLYVVFFVLLTQNVNHK